MIYRNYHIINMLLRYVPNRVGIIVCSVVLACGAVWFACGLRKAFTQMCRLGCQGNIKQITVLLYMYAEKNDGWFPDRDGQAGLEQLRDAMWDEAYLMNSPYLMNCPGVRARSELSISYDYRAGYRIDSDKDIGIVMDRPTNHKNYGNIGFVDGRVWRFSGKNWRQNADKKSGEQEASQTEPTQ